MTSPAPASLVVRPAVPADRAALGRLGAQMVELHHRFDPARFIPATSGTGEGYGAYLASQLERPEGLVLVAEAEGAVVGYAYAGLEGTDYMLLRGPAGVIYDLLVEPGRRGQGIGRRLLDATLEALRARGARQVVLSTAEQNEDARRLFARAGFRRTMVEMTRELS